MNGLVKRQFSIYTGLDGFMLVSVTAGLEPAFSILEALGQVTEHAALGPRHCDPEEGGPDT